MRHVVSAVAGALLLSTASFAAKPPPPPATGPDLAMRLPNGKGTKLVVANENGLNQMTLFTTPGSFRYDLAPRAQRQIAIIDGPLGAAHLKLLTYTVNSSGVYVQSSIRTLAAARPGNLSFSPDGTKIAFPCCTSGETEKLTVYDLTDDTITEWATAPYFWDIVWYKGGTSIAYSTLVPVALYELSGPGAEAQLLYSGQGQLDIDRSHTDPDELLLSYNDTAGDARIGLWKNGAFTNPDLASSARSWVGNLNCSDTKLAYGGVQNTSGSQAFYVRDLNSGGTTLLSKSSNVTPQYWPTC